MENSEDSENKYDTCNENIDIKFSAHNVLSCMCILNIIFQSSIISTFFYNIIIKISNMHTFFYCYRQTASRLFSRESCRNQYISVMQGPDLAVKNLPSTSL